MNKVKYVILGLSFISLINCAPKEVASQWNQQAAQQQNNNNDVSSADNTVEVSTAEDLTVKPVATKTKLTNALKDFMSKYGCTLLSTGLSLGGSFINPLIGSIGSQVAGMIFGCNSSGVGGLAGLLPNGSSGQDQVTQILSQVLLNFENGKNPFQTLQQVKRPEDIVGMIGIVSELLKKNNDPKLNNLLDHLSTYLGFLNDQAPTNCGSMDPTACKVFSLINQIRLDYNLVPFTLSQTCAVASQEHALDMSLNQIFTHLGSDGATTAERLAQYGIASPWAENIVKGQSLDAKKIVSLLLQSPEQSKNIFSNLFTSMGVGFNNGYLTQCFTQN